MPLNLYDTLTRETREAFAMDGIRFVFIVAGQRFTDPLILAIFELCDAGCFSQGFRDFWS